MGGGWPMRRTHLVPLLSAMVLALLLTTCSTLSAVGDGPVAVTVVDVDRAPAPSAGASRATQTDAGDDVRGDPPPPSDPLEEQAADEPDPAVVEEVVEETVEDDTRDGISEADAPASTPEVTGGDEGAGGAEEAGGTAPDSPGREANGTGGATGAPLPVDVPPAPGARPARVVIPRIGVDNPLVPVGLHPDKSLVVPDQAHVAGWYTGRPQPGATGPAIIAGHNQWGGRLGVFYRLHTLSPGDTVEVHNDDGSVVRFEIERLEQHPKSAFPTERVYGRTDRAEVRVITCGGHFDRSRGSHVDNVIAFGVRTG
jgi:hypothetical protein